jgi:iduronate 2-sulfatase
MKHFASFALSLCLWTLHASAAEQLNVLFIMADDFRPEAACYGGPALTPNLDALAKRGVLFERAYCQQALCNPSRSSMLTGKRPDSLRQWNNGTHFRERNRDVTTLPLWFKEHGYVTLDVGKIFHNWHTAEKGDARSWSAPEFLHYATHGDDKPEVTGEVPPNLVPPLGRNYGTVPLCECRDVPDDAYYDGRVAAEAIRVLGEIKDRPFFLAVGFWKPHAPFNAPKKYWDMYQRDKLPPLNPNRPDNAVEAAFHDGREIRGIPPNQLTFNSAEAAEIRHGYFANISYMDAQLGKVLAALDQLRLADRTVITFVGDHGYHLGEHSLWGKTSNFELDARVPMIVAVPKSSQAGKKTTSLVELVDLFPTLVDLCALPKSEGLEGVTLRPILDNASAQVKPAAFTQHPRPAYYDREPDKMPKLMGCSVRIAAGRYTEWRDWTSGEVTAAEFYDHARDTVEMKNLAEQSPEAPAVAEARRLLRQQFPLATWKE